ncbi:tRNA (adenine(22)-N(1))-methyltransferase TrmK [Alkalihalobacillus sp. MEB130]|uniref:tRNA (adenine(22)-N(1))-methyltransferase n=1 Tax=Alkalihalobacillus sp. MEB130 TaxID=2976704 RepID=UPI0028DFE20F|nr:tRNA (adenine(22)-N(1))-methyltransferase TrmK [Alkalihalobacillus sp. MEB130]MDT8861768.1 tRNA (adenine(22)-N(1))-methyltransferase TrmK [Alkalihalobacillus sp. MEB130]
MNERHLSERLIRVANYVPKGAKVADIGSDHAYLPCYLCLDDPECTAIAGEVNEGPFQSAKKQVEKSGLAERIDVRKGNGLEVLAPNEVDTVTIAGMGGSLISTILDEGRDKLEGVKTLILQPNVSAHIIRRWLRENGWLLIAEEILEEDNKIYEILIANRGDDTYLYEEHTEQKILLGPYLIKEANSAFHRKWQEELKNWKRVLAQFENANANEQVEQKRRELLNQISMVEEVLVQ